MAYPESPKANMPMGEAAIDEFMQSVTVPDNLKQIYKVEKQERRTLIEDIYSQFDFLHTTYGSDDEQMQSFHREYSEGQVTSVFITKYDSVYSGVSHHMLVNTETRTLDLREKLKYMEFCLTDAGGAFDFRSSIVETETPEENWTEEKLSSATLMLADMASNTLRLARGRKSEALFPPKNWNPHILEIVAASSQLRIVRDGLARIMNGRHLIDGMKGDLEP